MRLAMAFGRIISKKAISILSATIFLIIGMLLVIFFNSRCNDPERIIRNLQKEIILVEEITGNQLQDIQAHVSKSGFTDSVMSEISRKEHIQDGFSLFIYRNDSLIYWSDNSVRISDLSGTEATAKAFDYIGNGWYLIQRIEDGKYSFLALTRVRDEFVFENQYLKSRFSSLFSVPDHVAIHLEDNGHNIYSRNGRLLFSLRFPDEPFFSRNYMIVLTILYFLAYAFFLAFIFHVYSMLECIWRKKSLLTLFFLLDLLLIRGLVFIFHFPQQLYSSELFSPAFFASSWLAPSLGDLLLHAITFIFAAIAVHRRIMINIRTDNKLSSGRFFFFAGLVLFNIVLFQILTVHLKSIIINSGISFNLNDIANIDIYSFIGFLCLALFQIAYLFFSWKTIRLARSLSGSYRTFVLVSLVIMVTGYFILNLSGFDVAPLIFLFLYFLTFTHISSGGESHFHFSNTLVYIVIFSLFTTYILYYQNDLKEKENRKILARNLAEYKDPIAEHKFSGVSDSLKNDTQLASYLNKFPFDNVAELDATTDYITRNFFSHYWLKYDLLITICDRSRTLTIRPDDLTVNCQQYFKDIIDALGQPTRSENFYFINNQLLDKYYLGIVEYTGESLDLNIFIEFFPKNMPKGLGYPELLIDYRKENKINWSVYSYARYFEGELFFRFGKYYYAMNLDHYVSYPAEAGFIEKDDFSHYIYPVNNQSVLIVSLKNQGFLDIVAPFSYISIFFGFLAFILFIIFKGPSGFNYFNQGFSQRLQFSITMLIFASFFLVGIGSTAFIISLNNNKNLANLSEKAHSVLIELEHKIAGEEQVVPEMEMYISDLLYKFSLVFFTDINLYYPDGTLLATSRPEIFTRGFISNKMNAKAYQNLYLNNRSLFIHQECIGEYDYLSAYVPLRNVNNDLIAYLNLPYFARQDELTNEISTFLVAFINIYVILIAIAIYLALIISKYISKPIQLLKEKLSTLKIGNTEQKIEWKKSDEIGDLVSEYNRMVDEIAKSAELLARSERESAWREMARQIAHEIKNPLTPMKLSVQYLQKAWDEKLPGWEERLNRFSKTIVEQIDSLSIIASAFSDFANMPKSKFRKTELTGIIQNAIGIFKDSTPVSFSFISDGEHLIQGDKEQLLRVFNNLIKNAIQAIRHPHEGQISIRLYREGDKHKIHFTDNGEGIPEDQQEKVFSPNFTTKSGGMGLGLAMIKNTIQNMGGTISFESMQGKGTSFFIELPDHEADPTISDEVRDGIG
jgi:two-component system, NtrC family, nitrogen regulation sensor histidine kinase NtrY